MCIKCNLQKLKGWAPCWFPSVDLPIDTILNCQFPKSPISWIPQFSVFLLLKGVFRIIHVIRGFSIRVAFGISTLGIVLIREIDGSWLVFSGKRLSVKGCIKFFVGIFCNTMKRAFNLVKLISLLVFGELLKIK